MKTQLDTGVEINDFQEGLQLIKLKPAHACWIVEFYNQSREHAREKSY